MDNLRAEISNLEKELSKLSAEEKNNLSVLSKIDKQNLLLGKSIKKLEAEERSKEKKIVQLENKIDKLQKRIKDLQDQFGDYLVWLYKQGDHSTLKYLFNAESVNQAIIRSKHLEYVHKESEKTVLNLKTSKTELE